MSTVYGGIWPSYDSFWWWKMSIFQVAGHSFSGCCAQYKTCHTGHFCFCTRYMTTCHWYMLAHPALPSFVPGCTRLAHLNARLSKYMPTWNPKKQERQTPISSNSTRMCSNLYSYNVYNYIVQQHTNISTYTMFIMIYTRLICVYIQKYCRISLSASRCSPEGGGTATP